LRLTRDPAIKKDAAKPPRNLRRSREKSFKAEQYGRHYHRHSVFCNMNASDQVSSFSKLTVSVNFAENANKRRQRFHAVAF